MDVGTQMLMQELEHERLILQQELSELDEQRDKVKYEISRCTLEISEIERNNLEQTRKEVGTVGQMARIGDVWCEILDVREFNNQISHQRQVEYKLYSKDYWVPSIWIKEIKNK